MWSGFILAVTVVLHSLSSAGAITAQQELEYGNTIKMLVAEVENEGTSSSARVSQGGVEVAIVREIIDGDTIKLEDGQTVRYIGINAPETQHPTKPDECFGKEAYFKNKELVLGKEVELQKDVSETDRYGRLLRYVWVKGTLVNEVLVQEGYALASSYPPDIAFQEVFQQAEADARQSNQGLWGSRCR